MPVFLAFVARGFLIPTDFPFLFLDDVEELSAVSPLAVEIPFELGRGPFVVVGNIS